MRSSDPLIKRRIIMALIGNAIAGVSVGLYQHANFGLDPYQCFAHGFANIIPLGFGTVYMLINLVQLGIVFLLDRHYIGITTFINLFLLGYVAEFTGVLLSRWFGAPSTAGRFFFLIVAILTTCVAAALYYTADLGVSTYDAIPLHISDCRPRLFGRVVPFRAVRVISDVICVLVGLALGVRPGVSTVITALFMGPLITFFRVRLSDPLLRRGK